MVTRNKARLVAQSYTQIEGIEFDDLHPCGSVGSHQTFIRCSMFVDI